ncbi:hypothetical protein M5D96_013718 [Drosophila gunungcola]|uniref:Odorant receptor n=1 Tax=Drosophila gunungcola TaxID=103775 RepID=A0A9P9YAX0_9MUSC|nr:hypothetical protein M5D96_013718 [Drosophila gunungcola]
MKVPFLMRKFFNRTIGVVEKSETAHPVAEDFLGLAMIYFRSMGVEPYESDKKPGLGFQLYLVFHIINMIFVWVSMMVFVFDSVCNDTSSDFLEVTIVMSYVTYGNVGVLKIIAIQLQKAKLTNLVRHLKCLLPPPIAKEQELYGVKHYLQRCRLISKRFICLFTTMLVTNSVSAIVQYVIQRWLLHVPNVEPNLPYVPIAPWSYRGTWRFLPTYLLQSIAAYTCTCGYIATDLMLFAVSLQVIMHFKTLARTLREFDVQNNRNKKLADNDLRKLRGLIACHIEILEVTNEMNDVFGVPLLLNFLNSTLLVCNVGFQLTIGIGLDFVGRQVLIIICALVEIYLICYFSQQLIDASNDISFAVYEMNWMEADPRFRKMLMLMSMRAQKPVRFKATIFLDISIETMSIVRFRHT